MGGGDCQDRSQYSAAETSSPTVSTTSIFLLAQIAAAEGRDVTTIDIGSAYLNAYMPKTDPSKLVFMRISKEVSQIMANLDNTFSSFINTDGTLVIVLSMAASKAPYYGSANSQDFSPRSDSSRIHTMSA